MATKPSRNAIDRLLRRTLSLRNPFHGKTREGRTFGWLMAALAAEQGADRFEDLSPMRQLLTWRLVMIHLRLAIDDTHIIAADAQAPRQADRNIAYTNALARIATALGVAAKGQTPDVARLLAEMQRPP